MWRSFAFAVLFTVLSTLGVASVTFPAHSQSPSVHVGTRINNGHRVSCRQGARLLRMRGFNNIRMLDCRGTHFLYRATRLGRSYDITVRSRDGRIVNVRIIRSRR
jgi:hypothetical protein